MGRPSKLSAEQQIQAIEELRSKKSRKEICEKYGISELTLYRYAKAAALNGGVIEERKAEERLAAQEVAAEMAAGRKPEEPTWPEAA